MYMIFDVESIGLHGEGFATAWQIRQDNGQIIKEECYFCPPELADGTEEGRNWVTENVQLPKVANVCLHPREIRDAFWSAWIEVKKMGATLWGDCVWPVETRFLSDCIKDDPESRKWSGPYPLFDISTLRMAYGLNPCESGEEGKSHNPVTDVQKISQFSS